MQGTIMRKPFPPGTSTYENVVSNSVSKRPLRMTSNGDNANSTRPRFNPTSLSEYNKALFKSWDTHTIVTPSLRFKSCSSWLTSC